MKEIELTQGQVAIVDDEDFEYLSQWKWYANFHKRCGKFYARANIGNGKKLQMHRVVIKCPQSFEVDHINHNTLDNQKDNLRIATKSENQMNAIINSVNKIGMKGVTLRRGEYHVTITKNKKRIYLGKFENANQAGHVYDIYARELFGEYALLNFPKDAQ
jgi:hypothetical protein